MALLVPPYGHTYALQCLGHIFAPALRPGYVALLLIPLGRSPSLHPLRPFRFVRELRRYYATVRLPTFVHHWLASLDFPMRPNSPFLLLGKRGLSQFSRKVLPCMYGVFDLVEPVPVSHYRLPQCCLPRTPNTSALQSCVFFAAQYPTCTSPCQRFA